MVKVMVHALVIFNSLFGNTKEVAHSLAKGLLEIGIQTDVMNINEIELNSLHEYDFLAIGGPTHFIGLSKAMKEFLKKVKLVDLRYKKGFSFDTRNPSRMNKRRWFIFENSAARRIEARMKKMKIEILLPRQSAIVYGQEGPLETDVAENFTRIGRQLGEKLKNNR